MIALYVYELVTVSLQFVERVNAGLQLIIDKAMRADLCHAALWVRAELLAVKPIAQDDHLIGLQIFVGFEHARQGCAVMVRNV